MVSVERDMPFLDHRHSQQVLLPVLVNGFRLALGTGLSDHTFPQCLVHEVHPLVTLESQNVLCTSHMAEAGTFHPLAPAQYLMTCTLQDKVVLPGF